MYINIIFLILLLVFPLSLFGYDIKDDIPDPFGNTEIVLNKTLFPNEVNISYYTTENIYKKKKFYIYNLPNEYFDYTPPIENLYNCTLVSPDHFLNFGYGEYINKDLGYFQSSHWSIFNSMFNRLLFSSRRTSDPKEADLFVIPFDFHTEAILDRKTCSFNTNCDDLLINNLINTLDNFGHFSPKNHLILWSGHHDTLARNSCSKFSQKCRSCFRTCFFNHNRPGTFYTSVPYPSIYHYTTEMKTIPWKQYNERKIKVIYIGGDHVANVFNKKIRQKIISLCNKHNDCHWEKLKHVATDNKKFGSNDKIGKLYLDSLFCLLPPGDDPSRKAVFDSILSGCIPVLFNPNTLMTQYQFNLGENAALDIAIHIPPSFLLNPNNNFIDFLLSISEDIIKKKQKAIELIAPRLQYSIPDNLLNRINDKNTSYPLHFIEESLKEPRWDPPFQDAVDVVLDGFFEAIEFLKKVKYKLTPYRSKMDKYLYKEYNLTIFKIPDEPSKFGRVNLIKPDILK